MAADNKQVPNQGGQQIRDALEAAQQRWGAGRDAPTCTGRKYPGNHQVTGPEYSMPVSTAESSRWDTAFPHLPGHTTVFPLQ